MLTITYYQKNIPNPSFLELDTMYAKALCASPNPYLTSKLEHHALAITLIEHT